MIKLMIEVSEAAELKKDVLDLAELLGYKVPTEKTEIEIKQPTVPKKAEAPKAETTKEVEPEEAPTKEAPEKPKAAKKPPAKKTEQKVDEEPEPEEEATRVDEKPSVPEEPDELPLEIIREKVAAFAKADPENKKAVKALLDEKGYKAVSDIPGAERQAFLDELEIE